MTDFSALYAKYAREVHRFALYLSGDRSEAEDITSETFVRAFASPESLRMSTVKGYLFTIARNLFRQGVRKRSRQVELQEDLPDPQADPRARAELKAEYQAALLALQRLPEVDRAALLLRAYEDMPYEEIAQILGISLASAKVKIHRARRALAALRP